MVNERPIDWSRRDDERGAGEPINSDSLRPDLRFTRRGTGMVGHQTRESFATATGIRRRPALPDIDLRALYPARVAHAAMLAAWEEKYGPLEREGEPDIANDEEIRAAARLGSSGRYPE